MNLNKRICEAFAFLLRRHWRNTKETDDEIVNVRRMLAEVRLELEFSRKAIEEEQTRRKAIETIQANSIKNGIESQLEQLYEQLAAPLSQLRMQSALLEGGTPVQTDDIMRVARQLAEMLEERGLEPIGSFGKPMPFSTETAQPLSTELNLREGEPVVVRIIGYRYHGRVLRRAYVERNS